MFAEMGELHFLILLTLKLYLVSVVTRFILFLDSGVGEKFSRSVL